MVWKKTFYSTVLVLIIFGIIYTLVWWLSFHGKFLPIKQVAGFNIPFLVSRYYDFGLICLWPIIITPLVIKSDLAGLGLFGMMVSFFIIGLPLNCFSNSANIKVCILTIILLIITWIVTESYIHIAGGNIKLPEFNRKTIIRESSYIYVFDGLGVSLSFIFSKGLLIGLMFGLLVTICLIILTLINNLVFKSLIRLIVGPNQNKKLITKVK